MAAPTEERSTGSTFTLEMAETARSAWDDSKWLVRVRFPNSARIGPLFDTEEEAHAYAAQYMERALEALQRSTALARLH